MTTSTPQSHPAPRPLKDIIAHLRACIADGSIRTTLIQTQDLTALCDAADPPEPRPLDVVLCTFGPPAERRRQWILKFEDTDKDDMHFADEAEALAMFERCALNWTCTLFVTAAVGPPDRDTVERCAFTAPFKKELIERQCTSRDGTMVHAPMSAVVRCAMATLRRLSQAQVKG